MKLLSLIAFCCFYIPTLAQTDSLNQAFIRKRCVETKLVLPHNQAPSKETLPADISHFEVVDLRPDTTRAGYWSVSKQRYEFVFEKSASHQISKFLNYYTHPSGNQSFLILIKKLWLSDIKKHTQGVNKPNDKGCIEFRGEAFLKTDKGYLPYAFLDTVIISPNPVSAMANFRLAKMFFDLVYKIATANKELAQKRKAFTFNELDSLNNLRFNFPMDTAKTLRKGVYASVEEFRNNQPSILNYEIQADDKGPQLYLKDEEGKTYYSRKMWGYCNGQICYAMLDGNLCPIFSVGHSFYVYGSTDDDVSAKMNSVGRLLITTYTYGIINVPASGSYNMDFYTIDPNTGKIY